MRAPDGPITRHLMVIAEAVKVATIASLKPGFPKDWLGPQIVKRVVPGADGPSVLVGVANTKTKPHVIRGNPLLTFYWPKAGRVMVLRSVNHPGSEMGPYLARKLTDALGAIKGV